MSKLEALNRWVDDVARLTQPDRVHWCDGSEAEYDALVELMLASGDLVELNPQTHPNCYLHRSQFLRRRARRASDLRLHARPGRCRPEQ